jgi:phosphoglycolate phosphatase-like HAD superfamily hydrolase
MTAKTFKAVLFDLDGTLIDTAPDFVVCLNELRA